MKYTIHYTLRADGPEGEVIEATVPEEPFTFEPGRDEILEDLEAAVTGGVGGRPVRVGHSGGQGLWTGDGRRFCRVAQDPVCRRGRHGRFGHGRG